METTTSTTPILATSTTLTSSANETTTTSTSTSTTSANETTSPSTSSANETTTSTTPTSTSSANETTLASSTITFTDDQLKELKNINKKNISCYYLSISSLIFSGLVVVLFIVYNIIKNNKLLILLYICLLSSFIMSIITTALHRDTRYKLNQMRIKKKLFNQTNNIFSNYIDLNKLNYLEKIGHIVPIIISSVFMFLGIVYLLNRFDKNDNNYKYKTSRQSNLYNMEDSDVY
jgi:multisubunit Na+/H+ antiporter MnhG subunit